MAAQVLVAQVLVIGAGVIGLSAGLAAQARGLAVTVIDRVGPAAGASAGNAGAFAFTDILPLASPGMMKKAPGWLLDPLGPLSVPPAYALQVAPWLYRFWRACAPRHVAASTAAQTALMDLSKAELEPFLVASGTSGMLRKHGNLQVYEGGAEFAASKPGWAARAAHGIEFHHLDARGMADLQPGLSRQFTHGTFTPGWYSIADPLQYTQALARRLVANGGALLTGEVVGLQPAPGGVDLRLADGTVLRAGQVVIAAGAFSHLLARDLGEKIPLETERGYNTTLSGDAFDLRLQVTFGGHGFVATRLSTGIRVGGAVELAGLRRPPNYQRAEAMLTKAARFLPGLNPNGGVQWMGFRPSLPDSLPAIGHARATGRVIYAFGHGHLGLTQSAGTARLVADLLTHSPPAIPLAPFSAQRF